MLLSSIPVFSAAYTSPLFVMQSDTAMIHAEILFALIKNLLPPVPRYLLCFFPLYHIFPAWQELLFGFCYLIKIACTSNPHKISILTKKSCRIISGKTFCITIFCSLQILLGRTDTLPVLYRKRFHFL